MRTIIFLSFLAISSSAFPLEKWECSKYSDFQKILVTLTITDDRSAGWISVAGEGFPATFRRQGFDRRWDFDAADDQAYNYAFVITPAGAGSYYDFSRLKAGEITKPSARYSCRQAKQPKSLNPES